MSVLKKKWKVILLYNLLLYLMLYNPLLYLIFWRNDIIAIPIGREKIVDQFLGVSTYLEVVLDEGVNVKCSFTLRRPFCPSFSVSPFFTF